MPSLTVLACPVCGAPLQPGDRHCAFCRSVVIIQTDLPRIAPEQINRAVVNEHIAKYRAIVRRDNNDETAHYGLGLAYFNLNLLDEAADELSQAARLMPENPHIQTQLAVVYSDLVTFGRPDANRLAEDRVDRALRIDPHHYEALVLKARLQARRSEWDQALATLRGVMPEDRLRVKPKLATALLGVSERRIEQRRWVEAAAAMREAAVDDPERARPALAKFLTDHASLLDDKGVRQIAATATAPAPPSPSEPHPHPAPPRRSWARGLLVIVAGLFAILVLMIVAAIIIAANEGPSGQASAAGGWAVVGFFVGTIAVIVLVIRYFVRGRRPKQRQTARPVPAARPDRKRLRKELLAGSVADVGQLTQAVDYAATKQANLDAAAARKKR